MVREGKEEKAIMEVELRRRVGISPEGVRLVDD
jgi:hypothetical protein